jgi:hypothetical protein
MSRVATLLAAALLIAGAARADLAGIQAEPNLEKRAEKALANAQSALKTAQTAYNDKGDLKATDAALDEVAASAQLAYDSLRATGKNPSKRPKHFKRAEIKTRDLLRRLDDFRAQMGADERATIERVRELLHKIHDSLLEGIMGGKRK